MALKWINSNGEGNTANAIRAIDYSTANGAHLSNNSWHVADSSSLHAAINRAQTNGKLFFASAGNDDNRNNDYYPHYPSNYDLENIVAVLATNHNDNKPYYSNFGLYSVDLGAPGGTDNTQNTYNIYSTCTGNSYRYLAGTSMAAPHVAGVAALVWGHRPNLNCWQVKTIIMNSVDPKDSLTGKCSTQGRLNAYNALTTPTPDLPAAPSNLSAYGWDYCEEVHLTWQDNSDNEDGFKIYRKVGNIFMQLDSVGPNVTTWTDRGLWCGQLWCYYVRAYNQDGNSPKSYVACAKTKPCYYCDPWGLIKCQPPSPQSTSLSSCNPMKWQSGKSDPWLASR